MRMHVGGKVDMNKARNVVGYFAGAASAPLFNIVWLVTMIHFLQPRKSPGAWFEIGFAIFLFCVGGAAVTLIVTALPWYFAVRAYGQRQRWGWICAGSAES
jgi:hypothetical protein